MKNYGLLMLPLLSCPVILSQGIWLIAQITHADLSSFDNISMHISVKFDDLFGLLKSNVLNLPNAFEHQIEIDAK